MHLYRRLSLPFIEVIIYGPARFTKSEKLLDEMIMIGFPLFIPLQQSIGNLLFRSRHMLSTSVVVKLCV